MKLATTLMMVVVLMAQFTSAQDSGNQSSDDSASGSSSIQKVTQPGKNHKILNKFLGSWDVETCFMMGGNKSKPESGSCTYSWEIEGRWLKSEIEGSMMGRPVIGRTWIGYDNFKQSFVATSIQNLDTAMLRFEGDLSQDGKSLVMYGQMDEYLTGEHDKTIKFAFRFKDENTIVMEIHDLHIGETGSMVIEQTLRRKTKTE